MKKAYKVDDFSKINLKIESPCVIFLYWDLWAGKTTLSKHIINNKLWVKNEVLSPTYTFYNKYTDDSWLDIYHFDLYRISNYDEFFAIWWEEILDNNSWIVLIEWPEKIKDQYSSDIEIFLKKTTNEDEREIEIKYN